MTDVTLARLTKAPNLSTTLPVTLSIGKVGNTEQSMMMCTHLPLRMSASLICGPLTIPKGPRVFERAKSHHAAPSFSLSRLRQFELHGHRTTG